MKRFSIHRMLAVFINEFQQMMRDRLTFAMAVGIPILQLVLFGYAINTDPKGLPTVVVSTDAGPMSRGILAAMQNTGYYRIDHVLTSEKEAEALIETGLVQFMVVIPSDFSHRLVRGEKPALLVSADATDPSATGNAIAALSSLVPAGIAHDLPASLHRLGSAAPAFEVRVHRRYNPEGLSRYNIVPGLVGTILTMTMVMLTSLAMTRERERGTMENLLATPVRPSEVMVGKILPYVVMGYIQLGVILLAAFALFEVPMVGSIGLLLAMIGVFIVANLGSGLPFPPSRRTSCRPCR
jgi:ABC-2 type transport system permease protein